MIAPVDRSLELFMSIPGGREDNAHRATLLPIKPSHAFTVQTAELSRQIEAMERELVSQRRRYVDFSSMRGLTDKGRDTLDASVASFLKGCVAQIDSLKAAAVADLKRGNGNASFPAHRLGGVAILNEQLQVVSKMSEDLRHARIRAAIDAQAAPQVQYSKRAAKEASRAAMEREVAAAGGIPDDNAQTAAEMEQYAQVFASENAALVGELIETREQVREAERTVVEIATLNQLFASKVLEQGREIETLYELAVEATMFVDRGNQELRKMKGKGPILKYYFGGGILLLIFAMFFLDWMANRRSIFFPIL
jgi:syntaxin 18